MAVITVEPYTFRNCKLNVKDGATDLGDFDLAIEEAILDPNVDVIVWKGAAPGAVFKDISAPDWNCKLTFVQDWKTAGSLSNVLYTNVGKKLTFALTANNVGTGPKKATFDAYAPPSSFGGQAGQVAKATVTLGVIGSPTIA